MNIADRIENALKTLGIPFYGCTPEFSDNEPERYVVYGFTEKGADYGEGRHHSEEFLVSVDVFAPQLDFELYSRIKEAMYGEGFCFYAGTPVNDDRLFPYITHYSLDFSGVWE